MMGAGDKKEQGGFVKKDPNERDKVPEGVVSWAEIDLEAIAANTRAIKRRIGAKRELIAVIKANAYGHGEVQVARAVLAAGATRLTVHRTIDGVRLRQAGIKAPILILGYTPLSGIPLLLEHNLTPTAIDREFVTQLSAAAEQPQAIHIKVDTGMSRYGLFPEEVLDFVQYVERLPNLWVEGLFSHFATADEAERGPMLKQWQTFQQLLTQLQAAGIKIPLRHICNSAGILALPEAYLDAVRPGLLLYGPQSLHRMSGPLSASSGAHLEEPGSACAYPGKRSRYRLWTHLYRSTPFAGGLGTHRVWGRIPPVNLQSRRGVDPRKTSSHLGPSQHGSDCGRR